MIFGLGKREKARNAAMQGTHEVIRSNLLRTEVSDDFWQEAYVLGIMYGMSMTLATLASRGSLPKQDVGAIALEVVAEISKQDRLTMGRRMAYLLQNNDADFNLAAQRASRLAVMYNNRAVIGDDSDIMVARGRALANAGLHQSLGTKTDGIQDVLVELNEMWIHDPMHAAVRMTSRA